VLSMLSNHWLRNCSLKIAAARWNKDIARSIHVINRERMRGWTQLHTTICAKMET
jgi:hypothetical protein